MAQTSQTFKKALSLALVMVFSAATSLPEFAESSGESKSSGPSAKSEMTSSENPLDSGKDILDYLFGPGTLKMNCWTLFPTAPKQYLIILS